MLYIELKNILTISKTLCRSALVREESRGSHYRSDFPEEDNVHWLKNIIVRKEKEDMMVEVFPVDREVFSKLKIEI